MVDKADVVAKVKGQFCKRVRTGHLTTFVYRLLSSRGGPKSAPGPTDRKSTRLNSSHSQISYAVFCLKKKKNNRQALSMSLSHSIHKTLNIKASTRFNSIILQ